MRIEATRAYRKGGRLPEGERPRSVWVRHEVVSGLEIDVGSDLEGRERKKIAEIVRFARSTMKEENQ